MVGIRHSIREHTPHVENEKTSGLSVIIAFCDMVSTVLRMNGFPRVVLTPQILLDINCADLATAIAFATRPDLGFETISSYPFEMISRDLSTWNESNYNVSREERYRIDDIKSFTDPEAIKSEILANFGAEGKKYPLMGVFLTNEFKSREVAAAAADGMPFRHQGAIPQHRPGLGSRHGVVIVGVDTTSLDPAQHFVEVKSSYGRRWGREGFSKVAFEEFECVLVPYYGQNES
ncbi:hypothetical protein CTI12_AA589760 [Artemisia annua]|uniref:Peptidase C1A papain C-terminal domain-containing protein n=1 Tax=Artemisia annua TaxID=35608 RepID=A0A2U1KL70_ARTAN|nr:hypothetical protein CTI12_AA589760 [Artemisia annua]